MSESPGGKAQVDLPPLLGAAKLPPPGSVGLLVLLIREAEVISGPSLTGNYSSLSDPITSGLMHRVFLVLPGVQSELSPPGLSVRSKGPR